MSSEKTDWLICVGDYTTLSYHTAHGMFLEFELVDNSRMTCAGCKRRVNFIVLPSPDLQNAMAKTLPFSYESYEIPVRASGSASNKCAVLVDQLP